MKKLNDRWLKVCVWLSLLLSNSVLADADDVFKPLNEKTDELVSQITTWAASISLLCIVAFGALTMTGKIAKVWGVSICAGCLIILLGSGISSFLLT